MTSIYEKRKLLSADGSRLTKEYNCKGNCISITNILKYEVML